VEIVGVVGEVGEMLEGRDRRGVEALASGQVLRAVRIRVQHRRYRIGILHVWVKHGVGVEHGQVQVLHGCVLGGGAVR
jgi:hypothetical protein